LNGAYTSRRRSAKLPHGVSCVPLSTPPVFSHAPPPPGCFLARDCGYAGGPVQ
jgi:hypothetical protein